MAVLREQDTPASPEQQQVLAGWSSWGALPEVFDPGAPEYSQAERDRVRELLGPEGWEQAKATTLNAHYTDPAHAAAMWQALTRAGLESGRVLEPGCGVGEFIGQAPAGVQMVGVELDETSAQIAAALHPSQEVHAASFSQAQLAPGSFVATVGNVPFGSFPVADQRYNGQNLSIHNYFIAKSLRMTAPGGYVAVMTSTWTMDSKRATARREFARYGDLVGGVRLPRNAMRDSAGTDVMTDVLLFRRRRPEEKIDQDAVAAWVEPGFLEGPEQEAEDGSVAPTLISYSKYFKDHPENVLGEISIASGRFGPTYRVDTTDQGPVATQLSGRLNALVDAAAERGLGLDGTGLEEVVHRPGLHFAPVAEAAVGHVRYDPETRRFMRYGPSMDWSPVKVAKSRVQEARALLVLRDQAVQVLQVQSTGQGVEAAQAARERLHQSWQEYIEQYGPINRTHDVFRAPLPADQRAKIKELEAEWRATLPEDSDIDRRQVPVPDDLAQQWAEQAAESELFQRKQPHLEFLAGDPKLGLLRACETFDEQEKSAVPAALMLRDVVEYRPRPETAETIQDAIAISMDESREVDVDRVAGLLGVATEEAEQRMLGHVFTDPESGRRIPAVAYLAGNVRKKLAAARAANQAGTFNENIQALEAVLPEEIDLRDVVVNPGVQWVPAEVYEQFALETFDVASKVSWNAATESWEVEASSGGFSPEIRYQWGTSKRTPRQILEAAMNYKSIVVRYKDSEGVQRKDEAATTAAREKVEALRAHFNRWITEDPERTASLQVLYNQAFNSMVAPDYLQLGEALELPGLSASRTPYSYQRAAVSRVVNEPTVLLDHVVGAGKTGTMIMSAMELRRTGIAHKPAMVVPNHLVEQISREFVEWYPDANVLAVPTGLDQGRRQQWMGLAAAGDWDAVIIPQTVFERVEIDPGKRAEWLAEQLTELDGLLLSAEGDYTVKRIEAAKKRVQAQYEKATTVTDPGITFEETGIDYLFVDEAHHFKNLARSSDLSELACSGSRRASDLDFKLRALRERKTLSAERSGLATSTYLPAVATFATGTPVSNSMSEMWVMQHYLRPDLLQAASVQTVTAWGQQFTKSETTLKPKITGDGFDQVTRVGKYVNMPELMGLNRTFTDTVLREQLETTLPAVRGEDRILLRREPTEQVREYIGELSERIENLSGRPEKGADNMLKIMGDGRKLALDGRLVGLDADADGGRAAAVAEQIMAVQERTGDRVYLNETGSAAARTGGLQIVFCDQSTPREDEWNMYHALRSELVQRGMDAQQIAFIHDAATDEARQELFTRCRDGQVSVLIGSTAKMGTGTNIQARAVALHHVDCPWRPADLEQREGRIIRQGNQNQEVEIYSYATDRTFDVASWDMIARKARFIGQMKRGDLAGREMEDAVADLEFSASRAAAELSGDPRIEQLATMRMRIEQLVSLEGSWRAERTRTRSELKANQNRVAHLEQTNPGLAELVGQVQGTEGEKFLMKTGSGTVLQERVDAGEVLATALRREATRTDQTDYLDATDPVPVGTIGGIELGTSRQGTSVYVVAMQMPSLRKGWPMLQVTSGEIAPRGVVQSVEHFVAGLDQQLHQRREELGKLRESIPRVEQALTGQFEHRQELERLTAQAEELAEQMGANEQGSAEPAKELSASELGALEISERDYRNGDVWNLGNQYYRVGVTTEANGQKVARCWPADEDRPEDPDQARPVWLVFNSGRPRLVARKESALTELEKSVITLDTQRHRYISRVYGNSQTPRRVMMQHKADRALVEGVFDGRSLVLEDGSVLSWQELDLGAGLIELDVTSPEEQAQQAALAAEKAAQRGLHNLMPGEVLSQDVENLGRAGDYIRLGPEGVVAISPDTGKARPHQKWRVQTGGWSTDTSRVRVLTDQEKVRLYGAKTFKVAVSKLRRGDVVAAPEIDARAKTREPVTVIDTGWGNTVDITYQSGTTQQSGKRHENTQVTVLDRAYGALDSHELLMLTRQDVGAEQKLRLRDLADQSYVGRRIVIDAARVNEDQPGGILNVTVTAVNPHHRTGAYAGHSPNEHQITLTTDDGDALQILTSTKAAQSVATVVEHPVTMGELNVCPVAEVTAPSSPTTTVPARDTTQEGPAETTPTLRRTGLEDQEWINSVRQDPPGPTSGLDR
ncbi:DEAD/DEAH box helicase family protein [Micrococcus terreus]|uniref:helicase-related protein n=1 Tax=Micrococcus terreus TaxID=574650 RepID=UPI0021A5EA03|nr:helicase-related protein [Micrococcus terreus]MCT2090108.1 DEAD/DEAH box helicase family protein [Micrococcus terreus]